jgi:hypothetical protein
VRRILVPALLATACQADDAGVQRPSPTASPSTATTVDKNDACPCENIGDSQWNSIVSLECLCEHFECPSDDHKSILTQPDPFLRITRFESDASVVCGPTVRDPDKKTNVINPRVLVEITTDGTEDYDRGEKLTHYKQIPSLDWIVIVSHREPRIEVWSRAPASESWQVSEEVTGGTATLTALGCSLNVDAIWQAAFEP